MPNIMEASPFTTPTASICESLKTPSYMELIVSV